MHLCRTLDFEHIHHLLTYPGVYQQLGDDYLLLPEQFEVNEDPRIWYVSVNHGVGLFTLVPQNAVCWELHVAMMPWASTAEKWAAARSLVPWIEENTLCRRLTAAVPESNRKAIVYGTYGIGMKYVGRHEKAFMKDGRLQDLILLGMSIGGEPCPVP